MNVPSTLFPFLKELEENNHVEWFQLNKSRWLEIKSQFTLFLDELIPRIYELDNSIGVQSGAKCMYRINRDIRFSKDKSPYKTHIAAFIASGGIKQHGRPGYYLHLQRDSCSLGAGIFMPSVDDLGRIRKEIFYKTEEFKQLLKNKDLSHFYGGLSDFGMLKMTPKGFPKDFTEPALLRHKHYVLSHSFSDSIVIGDSFFDYALTAIRAAVPFNQFINEAMMD